jgi:hypothetical protein
MSTSIRARVDALERANGGPGEPPLVIILTAFGAPPDAEAHMSANVHGGTLESEPGETEAEFIERATAFEAANRPIDSTARPLLVAKVPAAMRRVSQGAESGGQSGDGGPVAR